MKGIEAHDGNVTVQLALATNDPAIPQTIKNEAENALRNLAGVREAKVRIDIHAPPAGSGRAGVGATQNQRNQARHRDRQRQGRRRQIDRRGESRGRARANRRPPSACAIATFMGPSISLMFGSRERPMATEDNRIIPIEQYGLRLMSMGFLLDDASPAILRGPMVTRYTQQFLRQVEWGELDYLVLDLPPGTGDIQLTIVQTVALAGAIIVTTPQEVALIDARKASTMFEKVNVPVLGLIENMSYFVSPSDGKRYDIFGSGGGEREAKRIRVPLAGPDPDRHRDARGRRPRDARDGGKPRIARRARSSIADRPAASGKFCP